jgi:hypothetical protein
MRVFEGKSGNLRKNQNYKWIEELQALPEVSISQPCCLKGLEVCVECSLRRF